MAVSQKPQGKERVEAEFFYDSLPITFYVCRLILSDGETARNVCADAYKKVSHNPEKIPDEGSLLPWMKNVIAVACSSYLRKQDAGVFLKNPPRPNVDKLTVYHNRNLNVTATAKHVENCISRMPLPQRFAAVCYYYNGMTVSQISTVMAVPVIRVKELMRMAAAEFALLTKEFNDKRVTTTKIDISALLDVSATTCPTPNINLDEILSGTKLTTASEQTDEAPVKHGSGGKKALIVAVCILLVSGVGVFMANSFFGAHLKGDNSFSSSSVESVFAAVDDTSEVASISADSESLLAGMSSAPEKEEILPVAPLYNITHETFYDASGDKIRECVYTYKEGRLTRQQTATQMFVEDLKYKWNKKGTKRITTDGEGNVCEVAWYDSLGNPTKLKYGDEADETVKYKWTYKYDQDGRLTSAKFKGVNSGKYTYSYDAEGRVTKLTTTLGEDKYAAAYTYDEKGMVLTKVETDFDGTLTETLYTYDYEGLTFTAALSDGTKIEGKIAENKS